MGALKILLFLAGFVLIGLSVAFGAGASEAGVGLICACNPIFLIFGVLLVIFSFKVRA